MRHDSGLDLIIPLLPSLNKKWGTKLKIIGPENPFRASIQQKIKLSDCEHLVEFHDWIEIEHIHKFMGDCFCGLNLLTSKSSYSSPIIQGKIMFYLQMLLPILGTSHVSPLKKLILNHKIGVITDPTEEVLADAIEELFNNQTIYQDNIRSFASKYPDKSIQEYLVLALGKKKHSKLIALTE